MPPFGGALPPTLSPAPPNAGPAVAPHGNPGNATGGLSDVKTALEALQRALPSIPMGTELHNAVLDSVKKIGAHMNEAQDNPQMKLQSLLQMMQRLKAAAPNAALAGMGGQQQPPQPPALGGAEGAGGAPPMPGGAAAGAMPMAA
jgi:hypothetical protein